MKSKSLIEKKPIGKTNLISLTEGFRDFFLEK